MGLIDPSRRVVARSVGIERAMFADAPDWIAPFMQADAAGAALGVPGPEVIGGTWDAGYHPLTAAPGWMAATFKPTPAGTWFLAPGSVPSAITFLGVVLSALLFWVMTDRDRVARRIAESERRNQEKSRLLASFAHDIRSPLISLIGSLELNREGRGPETGQVRSARSSAEALLQLVDDILELSFLGSGELTLHPSPVDLRQVAEALSDQIRPLLARKGLELCLDIDPSLPVSVEVDRLRLQQVLSNLLTNAVKYTDRGTVTLRIHKAGTREGHAMLDLAVIDTGVGIEPEDIPRILQEFGRLERETERREHGAGLGLAIVQRILTKMGAKLAVKTTPGQGSAFSFRLRIPIATGREVAGAVRPLSDIVILYAEDEPVIREVTARRLEEAGAWVICAEDGEDALRQLGTMAPDLLLIDLQMPGLDGVGLIQRLKDDSPGRTFPLFVLTSHISGPQAAEARAAGADAVFTKPVQVAALAAAFRARRGDAGRSTPIAGETANAEGESYIDAAKLNELVAILDPVRAVALIEEFEVTMRRDLSGLEAAIATTDLIQAMKLAHRGKGLCLVMGTSALASRLSAVELAAEARDAEAARALMRDAPKCLELTLQAMNAAVQASASSPSTMAS